MQAATCLEKQPQSVCVATFASEIQYGAEAAPIPARGPATSPAAQNTGSATSSGGLGRYEGNAAVGPCEPQMLHFSMPARPCLFHVLLMGCSAMSGVTYIAAAPAATASSHAYPHSSRATATCAPSEQVCPQSDTMQGRSMQFERHLRLLRATKYGKPNTMPRPTMTSSVTRPCPPAQLSSQLVDKG